MSSMRFLGSTSAELSPDDGPRTLLMSCTSLWKGSRAATISTADGIIARMKRLVK